MFDFATIINLPLIWGVILAFAILAYVVLDGFDLGIGMLFPFAPTDKCRDHLMSSISPFWDANETWLILGGGGLFAAFPTAYSIVMPAFYIPIIMMLLGLIMRGVAVEFRGRSRSKHLWNRCFYGGSLLATCCQGLILGGFITGIESTNGEFSGGAFDFLTPFSIMTAMALVCGYILLGSTWTFMKTCGETQQWAKTVALYGLGGVSFFLGLVSLLIPFMHPSVYAFWFSIPHIFYLSPIPMITVMLIYTVWRGLRKENRDAIPFFASLGIFGMSYLGLALSLFPYIVPYGVRFDQAAASPQGLSLMLVGVVITLPCILGYTGYCYYVFRGKIKECYTH